ncbi:hypothetical protein [Salmonella enterica]|uniref:hypothetical protein n=1 Tax=Salmonella enterica TaxID=28901 RepID=UPI003A9288C2
MITPETASQALSSWLAYLQITQETATQLITRAFLEQTARPEIAVHRIERDDGTVDYDAWRRNRINIFSALAETRNGGALREILCADPRYSGGDPQKCAGTA